MGRREALVEKFRAVTAERLVRLNRALTILERDPDDESTLTELTRELHTLKGEAKLLGFTAIGSLAHKLEEIAPVAQRDSFSAETPAMELLFAGFDLVEGLRHLDPKDDSVDAELEQYVSSADRLLSYSIAPPPSAPALEGPATARVARDSAPTSTSSHAPQLSSPARASKRKGPKNTGRVGTRSSTGGEAEMVAAASAGVRVSTGRLERLAQAADELLISHESSANHIAALSRVEAEAQEVLRSLVAMVGRLSRQEEASMIEGSIAGDIVSTRNRQELLLRQLQAALRRLRSATDEDRERVEGIEVEVRELRLVPLARLFDAYPRAIRDIARETGKRVNLEIAGADVEVDHAVLERVEASLVHLIGNAVDHGIESPSERRAAGKPAEATLSLHATQSGSRVTIVVEDDGRGIDKDAVLATARQHGLVDEGVAAVTLEDAIALLFAPGFTTRTVATETSGRGVGLDMVKADVEGMGGTVRITCAPGEHTRCELSLPVSLVRAPTLVVSVCDNLYGLPPAHTVRVLHPGEGERLNGAYPTLRIGGELVRLVPLSQLLAVGTPPRGEGTVLLLADGDRRLAIEVDRVVSETNVVQREMATLLVASRVTAGTAVIGQGQLVILLNVAELMRSAHGTVERRAAPLDEPTAAPARHVLVVDDSELTRDILVNLVSRLGYVVIEAVDGQDALVRLAEGPVDLIVTDLEMPVLDGFELLHQVRATPQLRDLPVVVCSTRGSDEDKRRAADLGADAYVVKSRFDEDELDRTLGRLMGAEPR